MIGLSIRRPVAVAMAYFAVALLGVSAWRGIPIDRLPDVSFPRLTVSFEWPGASPETVEAFATAPIEAAIQQLKWVERITSTSQENRASITVQFAREADMNFVRLELSERLAMVEEDLPGDVSQIRVQPYVPRTFEAQASQPVLRYTYTGPFLLESLHGHLADVVAPELAQVPGVALVNITGGRARLLEIELDPQRIAALGLTPTRVAQAIRSLDLVRDAGVIRQDENEWTLTISNRAGDITDVQQAVLLTTGGIGIRMDDVAVIRDTFEDIRTHYRVNGSPALSLSVVKERSANTVAVAEQVRQRVTELEALNPPGTQFILAFDQSIEIQRDIMDLRNRAAFAAIVIFGVLLLFLRSFRTAAIIFLTIGFSILIALNLIYFSGLTLNLLTLMGLALGFGLVVDNSIVVLENIYRRWQEGLPVRDAAEHGARDVVLPILAATMTTLIVFAPFVYFQGELAIYYMPLAIVVALTLLASLFVAFTFIPALAAKLIARRARPPHDDSAARVTAAPVAAAPVTAASDIGDAAVLPAYATARPPIYIRFYTGLLGASLRFPWVAVLITALCFAGTWHVFDKNVPRGQMWGGGMGQTRSWVDIRITMPRGADLERVDELTRYFEERLARMPEVSEYVANVSGTNSHIRVDFHERYEHTAIPLVIEEELKAFSLGFTGATVRVFGQGPSFGIGGGGSAPNYRVTLLGYNYERLAEIAEDLGARLAQNSRVREVDTNASAGFQRDRATEFAVTIDRDAASRYDLGVRDVVGMIQASVRGSGSSGSVRVAGEDVRFEVKLAGFREIDVLGLLDHVVATPHGIDVRLGDIIAIDEQYVLHIIQRENQQYERSVAYEFRGPSRLGDVINQAAIDATVLPPGFSIRDRTIWRLSTDDRRQLRMVLLIAIGLVFMVTAAIFESVRQPLCVLLAVPMALIGVFLIFFFVRANFTREAEIGVIMMGGIVVNNAILLVDHINRVRRESGLPLTDAIVRGTLERVRPILMTTTTTVFGLLPLVLFTPAANATIWNALTYALIGGLLSSTLFVLTTMPAVYLLIERPRAAERVAEVQPALSPVATST